MTHALYLAAVLYSAAAGRDPRCVAPSPIFHEEVGAPLLLRECVTDAPTGVSCCIYVRRLGALRFRTAFMCQAACAQPWKEAGRRETKDFSKEANTL